MKIINVVILILMVACCVFTLVMLQKLFEIKLHESQSNDEKFDFFCWLNKNYVLSHCFKNKAIFETAKCEQALKLFEYDCNSDFVVMKTTSSSVMQIFELLNILVSWTIVLCLIYIIKIKEEKANNVLNI